MQTLAERARSLNGPRGRLNEETVTPEKVQQLFGIIRKIDLGGWPVITIEMAQV